MNNFISLFANLHSFFAYVFIVTTLISIVYAAIGYFGKKTYTDTQFTLAKFAFIASHIQLLLGICYWVVLGGTSIFGRMGEIMGNSDLRKMFIEHPFTNIIAIVILSIGYIKIKKSQDDSFRNKTNLIFYAISFVLILSRIPFNKWLNQ
jgi:hypothetical protein